VPLSPRRIRPIVSTALALCLITSAARAADAPPGDSTTASADQLESIIVTANKRNENIKDVPTSISVLGGTSLQDQHIQNYDDLTRAIPSVSFGAGSAGVGVGEGLSNIEIRGISSSSGSATVGIYLDDTSLTVKNTYDGAAQPYLIDIDRVEVLRGPQGTLYGASSMAGTVKFISKQPDMNEFSGELATDLSATVHGGINYDEDAIVNIPVIPGVFALREAFSYGDDSGWIDHYSLAGQLSKSGVNEVHHIVSKTIGKIVLDSDLTITPELFFQRYKSDDSSDFYPALGLWEQDKEVVESQRDTVFMPSVTVTKGLSFADLTSVTSYFWRQMSRINDGTYYNSVVYGDYILDSLGPTPAQMAGDDNIIARIPSTSLYETAYGQATEEVRLTSRPPEQTGLPFKWVAGLYYNDQWNTHRDTELVPGLNADYAKIYGVPLSQSNNPVLGTDIEPQIYDNDIIYWGAGRYDERQYAAFGQFDFDILPSLHGSVGARYDYARVAYTFNGGGYFNLGNDIPFVDVARYYSLDPKFSLAYDVSPTSSIYATAAKGFRLGGPIAPPVPTGPNNPCSQDYKDLGISTPAPKYDSDKLWSYELGTKSSLLDRTLSVNAAIYYIDWQNFQQTIDLPICGFDVTQNLGNAESYGVELEAVYKVPAVKGLTLGVTAGATKATITSSDNPQTAAVGQKILFTPDWTATFTADYTWPISDDCDGYIRADYDWTGRSHGSYQQSNSNFSNPQYDVLNLSAGVVFGAYDVSLYVKNATDDTTVIQRPQVDLVITGYTVRPVTIGVHGVMRF